MFFVYTEDEVSNIITWGVRTYKRLDPYRMKRDEFQCIL